MAHMANGDLAFRCGAARAPKHGHQTEPRKVSWSPTIHLISCRNQWCCRRLCREIGELLDGPCRLLAALLLGNLYCNLISLQHEWGMKGHSLHLTYIYVERTSSQLWSQSNCPATRAMIGRKDSTKWASWVRDGTHLSKQCMLLLEYARVWRSDLEKTRRYQDKKVLYLYFISSILDQKRPNNDIVEVCIRTKPLQMLTTNNETEVQPTLSSS